METSILTIIEAFELLEFIDGSTVASSPMVSTADDAVSPNPAYLAWHKKDKKLLSVLVSTLTEETITEVIDGTTFCAAWLALEEAFSHSSMSRANQLHKQRLSLWRDSMTVEEYGHKFQSPCNLLAVIGRSVEESDKSHWFLRGLRLQFAGFMDTRMAMVLMPSFRNILYQEIQYDIMLRSTESSLSSVPAAFMANDRVPNLGSHQQSRGGVNSKSRGYTYV